MPVNQKLALSRCPEVLLDGLVESGVVEAAAKQKMIKWCFCFLAEFTPQSQAFSQWTDRKTSDGETQVGDGI